MRYRISYSDLASIGEDERLALHGPAAPLEFGHSLSDQIGGQIEAGFMLTDFVEVSRPVVAGALGHHQPTLVLLPALPPRALEDWSNRVGSCLPASYSSRKLESRVSSLGLPVPVPSTNETL